MDLNLFERAIARALPSWGIGRLGAKVGLEQARIIARGYDAARRDRRTDGWYASGGSANAELAPSLGLIRRRSRDLCRNNEWGANFKRKAVAHMIGTGITPRPKATAKRAKQTANEAWDAFVENCDPEGLTDYYGIQTRAAGEAVEGGAAFIRWYLRPPEFGLKVPLQCEVLEHDFLDVQKTEILSTGSGNVVIHGIEYDGYGRRVAYWLFPVHPGEQSIVRRAAFTSQRVPATECDHIFRVDRPGQVTGVPWIAPAMLRLRDLADYEEAELVRKKIEACFTVFVRRTGAGQTGVAQAVDQTKDTKNRRLEKIAPGTIAYVEADGEITTAAPSAASGAAAHAENQLYAFAAGVGLTFEQATGILKNVNFSSIREGKLDFWQVLDQWQWNMLIPQLCRPAWRRVMSAAAGRGLQVSVDIGADWSPPKRPWVNPLQDIKAEREEMAAGLESWREKVTARGYDPDKVLAEFEEDGPKLAAAGITPGATNGQIRGNSAPKSGKNPDSSEDENNGKSKKPAQ